MPAAGMESQLVGDVYQVNNASRSKNCSSCRANMSYPCASLGPITDGMPCPCTNRCPVFRQPQPYDLSLMYPKCVDRQSTPHFVTPIYNEPSPYIKWSTTSPEVWTVPWRCRVPFSKHLKIQCPNSAPPIGPNLIMFLRCSNY